MLLYRPMNKIEIFFCLPWVRVSQVGNLCSTLSESIAGFDNRSDYQIRTRNGLHITPPILVFSTAPTWISIHSCGIVYIEV